MTTTDSTFCTSWRSLIEDQMRNLVKKEGFPDKDGWTPQYKVMELNDRIVVNFTDPKSKEWYRKFRGANK